LIDVSQKSFTERNFVILLYRVQKINWKFYATQSNISFDANRD